MESVIDFEQFAEIIGAHIGNISLKLEKDDIEAVKKILRSFFSVCSISSKLTLCSL